ncbi:CinA-like protein [Vulcanimicrobium alpinum]|uniref:CinA-like protein n=1 Tax=Vulcanimicrobium alpinum TaxID=3016050 RepID=A0AAN2C9I3_UNVUL|nr:competence/damage-inducible protein A [Vulcanimicrobium alpinum]BDE06329.1 CinA-like protein [Vulcanimicrobium alpinum]
MASVEIVTVGTEILLGHLVDTNSVHIAKQLADHGVDVFAKHSVGDNADRLFAMLEGVLERADGAICTGGLGSTVDDLTKDAVGRAVGRPLVLHEPSLRAMEERFRQFGRVMAENNKRQAYLPEGCVVLPNPHGTAPGFVALRDDGKFVACMPGVPREMKPMLAERLIPWLEQRFALRSAIYTKTLHTVGIGESDLDRRVEDLFRSLENPKIAMLAHGFRVDVKIMAKAQSRVEADAMIAPVAEELRRRIGTHYFGDDETTLAGAIVAQVIARGWTFGTAESCTGGAIADKIVAVPGASAAFRGSIVAYANDVKTSLLDVSETTLETVGAVSEETAIAMARGARSRLGVDLAIATTGIAGPEGGTAEKPVGLVWFAIASPDGEVETRRMTFPGDRADVRDRASIAALSLLWHRLQAADAIPAR